jgi:DNA mismatch repair protein MutS
MSLVNEYLQLAKGYEKEYGEGTTVLLFLVGSFYEVYGDPEDIASMRTILRFGEICELAVVSKGVHKMAGFKDFQLDKYIRRLQEAGITVVVYDQMPAPPEKTLKKDKPLFVRKLAGIFSPGTYFPDGDGDESGGGGGGNGGGGGSNNIICIWCERMGETVITGVATMDIFTGGTTMAHYETAYLQDSPTPFDDLEAFVSIRRPRECLLLTNLPPNDVCMYAGLTASVKKIHTYSLSSENARIRNCEKQTYQSHIYTTFFRDYPLRYDVLFREAPYATQALCFLLDFVGRHNPHFVKSLPEPIIEQVGHQLHLPNHSLRQLHMIPSSTASSSASSTYSCVSSLLNVCITPMGRRRLHHHLTHPVCDPVWLQQQYDATEALLDQVNVNREKPTFLENQVNREKPTFLENQVNREKPTFLETYQVFRRTFSSIKDISKIMRQWVMKRGTMEQFLSMHQALVCLETHTHKTYPLLKEMESVIDVQRAAIGLGVSAALDGYRVSTQRLEEKIERIREPWGDEVKLHETEKGSLALLCTSRRAEKFIKQRPGEFSTRVYSSTHVSLHNTEIDATLQEYRSMKEEIEQETHRILQSFQNQMLEKRAAWDRVTEEIIDWDIRYARAWVAYTYHYCKPILLSGSSMSSVSAKRLRHPLIERLPSFQETMYVSNDLELSGNGRLIFGTNAVGKTSLIRALGLAVLMAQSGFYVACQSFTLRPYRRIITRILGNDDLHQGLSSFNVEVCEIKTIVTQADAETLILGDELCKGTETNSAIGLMTATLCHLAATKSSYIFATHMHELLEIEDIQGLPLRIQHMSVTWNPSSGNLTYDRALKEGAGSGMYGIEVCKKFGLPAAILSKAYEVRGQRMRFLDARPSRYHSGKFLVENCESCGVARGQEMHHIAPQHQAHPETGMIVLAEGHVVRKNQVGNLLWLCEKCHRAQHHDHDKS